MKRTPNTRFPKAVVLLLAASAIVGCSNLLGGGGSSNGGQPSVSHMRYSGRLALQSEVQAGSFTVEALDSSSPAVNLVMAVPIERNRRFRYRRSLIDDAVTGLIGEDGWFSLDLSADVDWVVMLLNTERERHEQVVAFVGLEDSADVLLRIPTDSATGDIEAGDTIEVTGNTAFQQGTLQLNESSLGLSIRELQEIARTNNLVRTVANVYVNLDRPHELRPLLVHEWHIHPDDTRNQFSVPDDYVYHGLRPYLDYRESFPFELASVKEGSTTVSVIPPAEASRQDAPLIPTAGVQLTGAPERTDTWGEDTEVAWWDGTALMYEPGHTLRIDLNYLTHPVPPGIWEIQVNDETVGFIDLGGSSPILPGGEAAAYVPSVQLDVDGDGVVERIRVNWKVFNPRTGQYEPIHDLSRFASTISYLGFNVDSHVDGRNEGGDIDDERYADATFALSERWKFFDDDNTDDPEVIRGIRIVYRLYGFDFQFYIRDFGY